MPLNLKRDAGGGSLKGQPGSARIRSSCWQSYSWKNKMVRKPVSCDQGPVGGSRRVGVAVISDAKQSNYKQEVYRNVRKFLPLKTG